jgi:hypothetical protein
MEIYSPVIRRSPGVCGDAGVEVRFANDPTHGHAGAQITACRVQIDACIRGVSRSSQEGLKGVRRLRSEFSVCEDCRRISKDASPFKRHGLVGELSLRRRRQEHRRERHPRADT